MRREGWIKDKGNGRIEGGEVEAGEGRGGGLTLEGRRKRFERGREVRREGSFRECIRHCCER